VQEAAMVASPAREEAAAARNVKAKQARQQQASGGERKPRPQYEQALHCPRCDSTNTKFCYYNNYSTTQPRYFCKACRRYWTQGGTLRNVPVGGGCRKNKHNCAGGSGGSSSSAPSASSSSSSDSKKVNLTHQLMTTMPTAATVTVDFPNVLPTFMSTSGGGFELPSCDHQLPFAPLSLSPNPAMMSSFLDILRVGFLDGSSNNYGTGSNMNNGMVLPFLPPSPFGAMQHGHGMMGDQQLVGALQGVEEVKPMATEHGNINSDGGLFGGGSTSGGAAQQEQQIASGDGGNRSNNNNRAAEYYWQGDLTNNSSLN